jgi:hypothetical protein
LSDNTYRPRPPWLQAPQLWQKIGKADRYGEVAKAYIVYHLLKNCQGVFMNKLKLHGNLLLQENFFIGIGTSYRIMAKSIN